MSTTSGPVPLGPAGVKRGFRALAAGELCARLLGFAAIAWMARALEPESFGLVTLGATIVIWFGLLVDFGTEKIGLRDIARRPEALREIAEPLLGLRLVLSVGAAALFAGAAMLAPESSDRLVLALFALVLPAMALNLRWMAVGVRRAWATALGNITAQIVFAGGVFLLTTRSHDTLEIPVLQALSELAYAVVVLILVSRAAGGWIRPRVDLAAWRRAVDAGLPLLVNGGARAVVYSFDFVMVAVLIDREHLGQYGAAYKPILFVAGLLGLLYVAFLAAFSGSSSADAAQRTFRKTLLAAVAGSLAIAAGLMLGASTFVSIAYGSAYASAAPPLIILALTIPILAVQGAYNSALIAAGRQALLMRNNLVGAGIAIPVSIVGILMAGLAGAAAATVMVEALICAFNYRSAVRAGLAPALGDLLAPPQIEPEGANR